MRKFFSRLIGFLLFLFVIGTTALVMLPLPGTVPVLMYHFVGSKQAALETKNVVTRQSFARQMWFLHVLGFHPITMDEYYDMLVGKRQPRGKEVLITFDDGNKTFLSGAYPALAKYQFPVTLFLISKSVEGGLNNSMTKPVVQDLLKNPWVTIGSHSRTHASVSSLRDTEIQDELAGSKKDLEEMFGRPIYYFAYPSGDVNDSAVRIAKESGYRLAFSTSHKKLKGLQESHYSLTRIKISRTSDNLFIFWFEISGIYQSFKSSKHKLRVS